MRKSDLVVLSSISLFVSVFAEKKTGQPSLTTRSRQLRSLKPIPAAAFPSSA